MALEDVRAALVQGLVNANLGLPLVVENAREPDPGLPRARVYFRPNQPSVATLGTGGHDEVDGFLQVDLDYPQGVGESAIGAKAEEIRAVFKAGARFTYNGQTVVIASCGRSGGRPVEAWYTISVTITFYAHISR